MKRINETCVANFADTDSKRFLLDVIDTLAKYRHVSVNAINKKDEELGLVWNWLNVAARSGNANKIIDLLKRFNLFHQDSVNEALSSDEMAEVRAAKRREKEAHEQMLLQLQLMSFDAIAQSISEKVPTAVYTKFKNAMHYQSKITYEMQNGDEAQIWFRNDGMVVCSTSSSARVKCKDDQQIYDWIDKHPAAEKEDETPLTADMIDSIAAEVALRYKFATPLHRFKKTDKVIGNQDVTNPHTYRSVQIWYRVNGTVFVKGDDIFRECSSKEQLFKLLNRFVATK